MKIDAVEACQELSILSENGSIMSMIYLGWEYGMGHHIDKNMDLSEFWLRRASALGSLEASFCLGLIYRKSGEFQKALEQFYLGASNNFTPSINKLGIMFNNGEAVDVNYSEAMKYWKSASDLGHLLAKRNFGVLFLTGRLGIQKIPAGAAMLLSSIILAIKTFKQYPKSDLLR